MSKRIEVSASILGSDFSRLADEIKKAEEAGCDRLHVDVMDGHFVPNITIGPVIVEAIRPLTRLPIEAHLMIENPGWYVESFIKAGADIIAVHAECYGSRRSSCRNPEDFPKEIDQVDEKLAQKDIGKIKNQNKKVYMTINPGSPLCIKSLLDSLDGILIMSVNPGFAGQKFMPQVLPKLKELRSIFPGDIEIDGGINSDTATEAVSAGANILVTASYFFKAANPKEAVKIIKSK